MSSSFLYRDKTDLYKGKIFKISKRDHKEITTVYKKEKFSDRFFVQKFCLHP